MRIELGLTLEASKPAAFDAIVIGAGAAGMMCAAVAGQRGRRVLLIEHYHELGEKIRALVEARRDAKRGLASLCIGGGMGVALAVERD